MYVSGKLPFSPPDKKFIDWLTVGLTKSLDTYARQGGVLSLGRYQLVGVLHKQKLEPYREVFEDVKVEKSFGLLGIDEKISLLNPFLATVQDLDFINPGSFASEQKIHIIWAQPERNLGRVLLVDGNTGDNVTLDCSDSPDDEVCTRQEQPGDWNLKLERTARQTKVVMEKKGSFEVTAIYDTEKQTINRVVTWSDGSTTERTIDLNEYLPINLTQKVDELAISPTVLDILHTRVDEDRLTGYYMQQLSEAVNATNILQTVQVYPANDRSAPVEFR